MNNDDDDDDETLSSVSRNSIKFCASAVSCCAAISNNAQLHARTCSLTPVMSRKEYSLVVRPIIDVVASPVILRDNIRLG